MSSWPVKRFDRSRQALKPDRQIRLESLACGEKFLEKRKDLTFSELGLAEPILRGVYGEEAGLWKRRWRLFFLATEGLFGHAEGREWGVSHYRLRSA